MADLAIIGAGIMGANHGRVAGMPEVQLAAVCDADTERAKALANGTGALATTELDEAIEAPTRPSWPRPATRTARSASTSSRAAVTCSSRSRSRPRSRTRERLIDAAATDGGSYGRPRRAVQPGRRRAAPPGHRAAGPGDHPGRSVLRRATWRDVVLDLMIHDIDLARAIIGHEIVEHHAVARSVPPTSPTSPTRCCASTTASGQHHGQPGSQNKIRRIPSPSGTTRSWRTCSASTSRCTGSSTRSSSSDGGVRYRQSGLVEIPYLAAPGEPLMHELRHFVDCVTQRREPLVTGEDGLAALRVCLEIRDSARRR